MTKYRIPASLRRKPAIDQILEYCQYYKSVEEDYIDLLQAEEAFHTNYLEEYKKFKKRYQGGEIRFSKFTPLYDAILERSSSSVYKESLEEYSYLCSLREEYYRVRQHVTRQMEKISGDMSVSNLYSQKKSERSKVHSIEYLSDSIKDSSSTEESEDEDFERNVAVFAKPDLILIIEKTKLYVSKHQLTNESPVFEKMLMGDFKEKEQTEIRLPGKKAKDFVQFLRCTFPSIDDDFTEETVHNVIPLAHEYQTSRTLKKADKFLQEQCEANGDKLTSQTIINNILEAEVYQLPTYLDECINIASRKYYKRLIENKDFEKISQETQLKICRKRWKDVDYMYEKTNFFKPIKYGRRVVPRISMEEVGEALQDFMHNN